MKAREREREREAKCVKEDVACLPASDLEPKYLAKY
jgi:hypothetical protein